MRQEIIQRAQRPLQFKRDEGRRQNFTGYEDLVALARGGAPPATAAKPAASSPGGGPVIQRKCAACEEEEQRAHGVGRGATSVDRGSVLDATTSAEPDRGEEQRTRRAQQPPGPSITGRSFQEVLRGIEQSAARSAIPAQSGPGDRSGQVPSYSKAAGHVPSGATAGGRSGEGEALGDEPTNSEAEYPLGFVGPLPPGDTYAVPHNFVGPLQPGVARSASFHPTITVVTPGTRTDDCGGYTYKVRWGIPASEAASAGWIVQKVTKSFVATDCNDRPVAPVPFDDPAGYPFWEAWEFTAGRNVWVGPASGGSAHTGDTFGGTAYGPGTKGRKVVTGEVKAIVGFALPGGMTVRNAAPAWALPYTRAAPAQFTSTLSGAAHSLTAEWNCCPNGTVTQATNVTTNP